MTQRRMNCIWSSNPPRKYDRETVQDIIYAAMVT
jgi:hypothetical protein